MRTRDKQGEGSKRIKNRRMKAATRTSPTPESRRTKTAITTSRETERATRTGSTTEKGGTNMATKTMREDEKLKDEDRNEELSLEGGCQSLLSLPALCLRFVCPLGLLVRSFCCLIVCVRCACLLYSPPAETRLTVYRRPSIVYKSRFCIIRLLKSYTFKHI